MQPLYTTVLFKLWVIIHVVNRMITFLTDRTFCPESPDGSLPPERSAQSHQTVLSLLGGERTVW